MKQKLLFVFIIIFMIILIFFPDICINGTKDGIILWYNSIVPTLLPYMMLTNMLMKTGVLENISSKKNFFSINTIISIFVGFFCGYPMGAYYVSNNYKSNNISKATAQWLLSFVNLCSPAFIIQFVVINNLSAKYCFPMLISIYGSAIIYAICTLPFYFSKYKHEKTDVLVSLKKSANADTEPLVSAMLQCLKLLAYIILFSIILKMVTALINTVTIRHIILIGILEITNGIAFASENAADINIAALLMSAFTAFGSISCIFQTNSVLNTSKLNIWPYIIAKIIQAFISLLIMYMFILFKRI